MCENSQLLKSASPNRTCCRKWGRNTGGRGKLLATPAPAEDAVRAYVVFDYTLVERFCGCDSLCDLVQVPLILCFRFSLCKVKLMLLPDHMGLGCMRMNSLMFVSCPNWDHKDKKESGLAVI